MMPAAAAITTAVRAPSRNIFIGTPSRCSLPKRRGAPGFLLLVCLTGLHGRVRPCRGPRRVRPFPRICVRGSCRCRPMPCRSSCPAPFRSGPPRRSLCRCSCRPPSSVTLRISSRSRERGILTDQPVRAQFRPHVGRNFVGEQVHVLGDAFGAAHAGDDRRHRRMTERELEGRRLQRGVMAGGGPFSAGRLFWGFRGGGGGGVKGGLPPGGGPGGGGFMGGPARAP